MLAAHLDGDGIATPSEREHIIRQIQAWGGQVVDKLDTQTDFLVLGSTPINLQSGVARIASSGAGTWVSAATASGGTPVR